MENQNQIQKQSSNWFACRTRSLWNSRTSAPCF